MFIRSLNTLNYRNLHIAELKFEKGLNVIIGGNAQGKSNLLEAIFLSLSGELSVKIEQAIQFGQTQAFVRSELITREGMTRLEIGLAPGKRLIKVDNQRIRLHELPRFAAAVLIGPADSELVLAGPSLRRAFLDSVIGRISAQYRQALTLFERVLTQRNAGLRRQLPKEFLAVWTTNLIQVASEINQLRARAVKKLELLADQAYRDLAGEEKTLTLELKQSHVDQESFNALYHEELRRGTTLLGPHRDDLIIKLAGHLASDFASRGEARTIALALRQAEFALLEEKFHEPPVLLIDDLSAELDQQRRQSLLNLASRAEQAIVTAIESELAPDIANKSTIERGTIQIALKTLE